MTAQYKDPINTWADFYKAHHRIGMVDDPNATFTTLYAALDKPLCDGSAATYKAMEKILLDQRSSVVSYSFANAIERVGAGDVSVQLGWYTFVHQNRDVNKNLTYIVPKGPAYVWNETFFVPKTAKNVPAAKKFLTFMLRPENSGAFNNFVGYVPPVKGAEAYLDAALKASPELDVIKSRAMVYQKACPLDVIQNQAKIWKKVMQR